MREGGRRWALGYRLLAGVEPWLQVFGNSPDETAYCRLVLNRETVPDALVMIQPTLLAYSLDGLPTPVRIGV